MKLVENRKFKASLALAHVSVTFTVLTLSQISLIFENSNLDCMPIFLQCYNTCICFLKIRLMDLWAVFGWTGGGLCALYVLLPFLVRLYPWIAHRIVFLHFGKPATFSFLTPLSLSTSLSLISFLFQIFCLNIVFYVNSIVMNCVIFHFSGAP